MDNFPGEYGLKRVKLMLKQVGNPQEKINIIHIAGTSGKGSTSIIISNILMAHGLKVGLHVKPHMYDLRERFQVNNEMISEELFEKYCDTLFRHIEEVNSAGFGKMTYYEVLISLAFLIFAGEKVECAVIETGVGGTLDGSNVVENPDKICVITSIGFDHTAILGKTIDKIAAHKAGIIQQGNSVFALEQEPIVNEIIQKRATEKEAKLTFVDKKNINTLKGMEISLLGTYQVENAALAIAASSAFLKKYKMPFETKIVESVLKILSIPGRFDRINMKGKTIILDGAHNVQKMQAFLSSLKTYYPNRKFTFLLGFKEGKDISSMIKQIVPLAKKMYLTDFFNNQTDFVSISTNLDSLSTIVKNQGFTNFQVIYNAASVLDEIIEELDDDILIITGSLYLLSDMYKKLRALKAIKV